MITLDEYSQKDARDVFVFELELQPLNCMLAQDT